MKRFEEKGFQMSRLPIRTGLVFSVGLVLLVTLVGCSTVDPAPFTQFATNLESLRTGAEKVATQDVQNARNRFVGQVKAGKIAVPDLQLGFTPPFGYQYSFGTEPLFVTLGRFQQGLGSLNEAMIGYANILTQLAGQETLSQGDFDQLARDLNANASSAAQALKLKVSGNETALLSTAAVTLFRQVLEHQRRKGLEKAISAAQPQVDAYAKAVQEAIQFLATGVTVDYHDQIGAIFTRLGDQASQAKAAGTDPPPVDSASIDQILALNLQTETTLGALSALATSYQKLPAAHADLKSAASKHPGALTGLISFTNEALRLDALYQQLAAANPSPPVSGGEGEGDAGSGTGDAGSGP